MTGAGRWRGTAPAKVNLFLRVLAREAEGHHQVETLLQALELADLVVLERTAEPGVSLEVGGVSRGALGPDEENLAVGAARAYLEALGEAAGDREAGPGIRIHLEKRIPHGAGLGGGSSDAGAVLRGMDALHGGALGTPSLVRIGARLGADVAFFTLGVSRALAWGRGDRLLPLGPLPAREVVLACPPEPIATPWAYRVLAEWREGARRGLDEGGAFHRDAGVVAGGALMDPEALGSWEGVGRDAENDFEPALGPLRPELGRLRDALARAGAAPALLSGSGSAVFGVFASAGAADEGASRVEHVLPTVRVIRTRTMG